LRRPVESAQYLAIRYTERLAEAGAVTSVGSRGDSYDNALAETIIGLYKTELIRRRGPWKGVDDVEYATLEWVDWFNHRRSWSPSGTSRRPSSRPPTIKGRTPAALPHSSNQASSEPGAVQHNESMPQCRRQSLTAILPDRLHQTHRGTKDSL
jgi:transposase InsO family protein